VLWNLVSTSLSLVIGF